MGDRVLLSPGRVLVRQGDRPAALEMLRPLADGRLASDRFESYHKLQGEIAFLERQQDERAAIEEKRRWKVLTKAANKHIKSKRG